MGGGVEHFQGLCKNGDNLNISEYKIEVCKKLGYVWLGLVWFYDISTIVSHLMPCPLGCIVAEG